MSRNDGVYKYSYSLFSIDAAAASKTTTLLYERRPERRVLMNSKRGARKQKNEWEDCAFGCRFFLFIFAYKWQAKSADRSGEIKKIIFISSQQEFGCRLKCFKNIFEPIHIFLLIFHCGRRTRKPDKDIESFFFHQQLASPSFFLLVSQLVF